MKKNCYTFVSIVLQKKLNLTLKKTAGKHPENSQKLNKTVKSVTRAFYNSKIKNIKCLNVSKNVIKSHVRHTSDGNLLSMRSQVFVNNKLTIALTDTNCLCGDYSIKNVMRNTNNNFSLPHIGYAGVKVCNRFEQLSWFVDDAFANPYAASDGNVGSNNNDIQKQDSHTKINHEKLSIDYTSTAAILK